MLVEAFILLLLLTGR